MKVETEEKKRDCVEFFIRVAVFATGVLAVLNMTDVINMPWLYVMAPLWIPALFLFAMFMGIFLWVVLDNLVFKPILRKLGLRDEKVDKDSMDKMDQGTV